MTEIIIPLLLAPKPVIAGNPWIRVRDGHPTAWAIFQRHYSRYQYADGRRPRRFVGPGKRVVLITEDGLALFVWRKFQSMNNQAGINCAVFRNEGPHQSSDLILHAEAIAREKWPGLRMYTYVNADKIRSTNPGYCFKMAGWQSCGRTKSRNLFILEKSITNGTQDNI